MTFDKKRRQCRGITVWKKRYGRALALLLSFVLAAESAPVSALAAEAGQALEKGPFAVSGNEISPVSDHEAAADAENKTTTISENEVSGDAGKETSVDSEQEAPEDGEQETPADPEQEAPGNGENETPTVSENEVPTVSENTIDTVSENTTASVSDNALSSLSENSLDAERAALIEEAQEAFDALLSEKPLMALLYHAESYDVREKADGESGRAASLEIGHTLYIQGVEITHDDVWYRAQYLLNGSEGTGYVQSGYLAYSDEDWLAWEEKYLFPVLELEEGTYEDTAFGMRTYSMMTYAVDTSDISAFPKSYQADLTSLKNAHPNWTFVPMKTGLDFQTSVTKEMGDKSLIQKTNANTAKGWVGSACPSESGWYYATQPAVAYHMDPRNFLSETYIFQFEQLTYNASYHTEAAVQTFLDGTFMKGKLPDDSAGRTYAKAFYEIGSGRKLSPIHLASRVYQEQGQGTSGLISGTYPGYEGYYNFFNVGVNGSSTTEKIVKGLTYAKDKGWNTRYKSLEGGAATIGNNYILKGQDTIYLEKFNVNKNSSYGVYNHQYMQNIQAPGSESSTTKKMYANAGSLNSAFVFKIPVFENMPDETAEPEIPLQNISLDKETLTLRRPDTVVEDTKDLSAQEKAENISEADLQVRFDPADTTADRKIVWTSANKKIATVTADPADSSRAVVTAVGTGEVKITAKASQAGNQTAVCLVKVTAPIYRLELSDPGAAKTEAASTLFKGQSVSLNAEYWPKDTTSDQTILWTSSNEDVAVVQKGRVTAKGEGMARITAAAAGYTASYDVTVKACNVIFHKEDGTVSQRLSMGFGDCVADVGTMPEAQPMTGRIFRGWYTKAGGQGSVFTGDQPVYAEEIHVYPQYQEIGAKQGFYVIPVGDQTYTGSAVKPKVRVFDSAVAPDGSLVGTDGEEVWELVEGRDYTLSYKNNKNVNTGGQARPTITVKGKGNYMGTEYVYFDIVPKSLTDRDITAEDITVAYSGKTQKSAPAVYRAGKKLTANKDYTRSYPQTGTGAYSKPGVYPVVLTGKGGYTGTITIYETITTDVLLSKVKVAKIPKQTFTNEQAQKGGIRPASLTVSYRTETLVEGEHYTLSYSNDHSIGKATVTLTAVAGSGYAGSKNVTYQITGTSIAKAEVEGLENKEYVEISQELDPEGEAYEREYQKMLQTSGTYSLTLNDRVLTQSRDGGRTGDYVVSYEGAAKKGAVKAGTATIVFQGINEYSGKLKKTYKILPCEFKQDSVGKGREITLSYYTQDAPDHRIELADIQGITTPYMKGGSKPVISLSFQGQELKPGKDYTISYKNNKAVTAPDMAEDKRPSFTVKGKGNFKGKLTGQFVITDGRFDGAVGSRTKVTLTASDVVYRGKKNAYKPKIVLRDVDGAVLTAGRDYRKELQYTYETDTEVLLLDGETVSKENRKAGAAVEEGDILQAGTEIRVTAQGIGVYGGDGSRTPQVHAVYRIVAKEIAKAKVVSASKTYQYGRPVTLTSEDLYVTISGEPEPLVFGRDYVIVEDSYTNHMAKGKAKVTLQGIGNYGGRKTITYKIGAITLWQ